MRIVMTSPIVYEIATRLLKELPENEAWLKELDHSPDQE
jgi:hypothetical protein